MTATTTATRFRLAIDLTLFDRDGDVIGTRSDMTVWGDVRDAAVYLEGTLEPMRDRAGVYYTCYWSMEQYRVDDEGNMETVRVWDRRRRY